MATDMQKVQFWLNNQQYNDAVKRLGSKDKLYGFAKEAFLKKMEELKNGKHD